MRTMDSLYDLCPRKQVARNEKTIPINVVAHLRSSDDRQKRMEEQFHHTGEYILLRGKKDGSFSGLLGEVDVTPVREIGESEILSLVSSVPEGYRKNAVFLMNFSTLYGLYNTLKNSTLCRMSTDWSGRFLIMNTPVMLTNAMPMIGRGSVPVLYGDFSGVRIEDGGRDAVKTEPRESAPKGITCSLKGYMGCSLTDRDAVKGLKII